MNKFPVFVNLADVRWGFFPCPTSGVDGAFIQTIATIPDRNGKKIENPEVCALSDCKGGKLHFIINHSQTELSFKLAFTHLVKDLEMLDITSRKRTKTKNNSCLLKMKACETIALLEQELKRK